MSKVVSALFLVVCFTCSASETLDDSDCFFCHGDADFSKAMPDGSSEPLFVDEEVYSESMHAFMGCTECHDDIKEVPHQESLKPVNCAACHEDEADIYAQSLHGKALAQGDPLAPSCADCHGKHDILSPQDIQSKTNPIHIPDTCGQCHAEDAPVAKARNVNQHDILVHYTASIHGEGLLKKGLRVTAVCSSCHTAHRVLPHTDPESTIHRDNVVKTCTQCHALIEEVHRKVINGELWEEEPANIPICIDCHQPHEARKVYYDEGVSDRDCMSCHASTVKGEQRELAAVDAQVLAGSTHTTVRCAQCHTGVSVSLVRSCETVAAAVDCSICHEDQVKQHAASIHGQKLANGDADAPKCLDCHAGHGTQSKKDPNSPTFPKNVPELCGRCHRENEKAARRHTTAQTEIINNYSNSIHGKGLLESGLLVTATCTSCHTAHSPLPSSDPNSSVNEDRIADTCGNCHQGIKSAFATSIHSPNVNKTDKQLPVCNDCHTAHTIRRTDEGGFKQDIVETCGKCHEGVIETYFETYHGKVSKLGSSVAAKCYDCHGSHDVQLVTDPRSHVGRNNIVETCAKCHPGSNRRFAGYLTHATHHDPVKYPKLFITFWAMTALLAGTFAFFGLHTLAWLPRSFREMRERRTRNEQRKETRMFQRFDPIVRQMHFVLILTFFGLALTGMTLKFSYMPWALWLSKALGGFHAAGTIHRVCAVILIGMFGVHLLVMVKRIRRARMTLKDLLFGSRTLLPTWTDAVEFFQTIRWFAQRGPRPRYGFWTYWEKFDYFAVFWGVAIIGSSGLLLWFPEWFTLLLPGWLINVATIVHSDEALLAVGFIFTIHFFNTHFRPDKFPMDMAMFTGRVPLDELKHERPRYYEELVEKGELESCLIPDAPKEFTFWAHVFGAIAVFTGLSLVVFIVWSMVFGYK